jgi:hypothetical protein
MKQIILTGLMALAVMQVHAQDFKAVLEKTFTAFDTATDQNVRVEQSNKLTLIAKKWENEWITHYYVSLSRALLSFDEKDADKRDAYLDEADKEKDNAVSILKKDNDETFVLAALIANARLAVNPSSRWMKYGKVFSNNLESAKEINPDNPRMYFLQGRSKYHTPKAFGGGKKNALPYFEKADGLFAIEKGGDIAKPYWGKQKTAALLVECKGDDKE